MKYKILFAIGIAVLLSVACETTRYSMGTPEGFAKFEKEQQLIKFVSSDSIRIKARSIKNEPYGDIAMWSDTVKHYLTSNGYHEVSVKEIATPENLQGRYTEYRIRYNAEDYIYAVALFVDRENIFIVEAGGEKKHYDRKRNSVVDAVKSFRRDGR
ncbi:MAG TPA: hypothetical protein PK200_04225 [Spirochaetota bacterium]|mgnify:CR=1 FL=1|nr:hypothetical protein [Spirochaetota bacterium]HQO01052.1 hypothetical protein [Spirochaetota bacterium]HQP47482.1 hypothetical protein [Spirochaetota bacterium]